MTCEACDDGRSRAGVGRNGLWSPSRKSETGFEGVELMGRIREKAIYAKNGRGGSLSGRLCRIEMRRELREEKQI